MGKILKGECDKLIMENLDAKRDIGNAKDYVEGMWKILQDDEADDYVLSTGKTYSIRELIEISKNKLVIVNFMCFSKTISFFGKLSRFISF